jgi:hypothetical protein
MGSETLVLHKHPSVISLDKQIILKMSYPHSLIENVQQNSFTVNTPLTV